MQTMTNDSRPRTTRDTVPDELTIRAVQGTTGAARQTVLKVMRGEPVRGYVRDRVVRAFRDRGFDPPQAKRMA